MLVAAAWEAFKHLVDVAPISSAYAHWDGQRDKFKHPKPGTPPVDAFMLIDEAVVSFYGGMTAAAERLEAFEWAAVRDDEHKGVIMQLGREPSDPAGDRIQSGLSAQ